MRSVKFYSVFVSMIFLGVILGCDQISAVFNKGKTAKSKAAAPTVTPKAVSSTSSAPAPAQSASAPLPANVLARVDNWTITLDEFNERLNGLKQLVPDFDITTSENKQLVLDELVRQQLLVSDAEKSGIANKKEVVDAINEFKRTILVREVATKITEGAQATEAEAQEYYNNNKALFTDPAEWRVREIVVGAQSEANEILIELLKGSDFGEMAKTRSKGKSAPNGGDLGFITEPPFPEMGQALAPLDVGGISSVFKGPEGFYIVKLEEKKGGAQREFAEIKADIITGLTQLKQQQAILEHIEKLKAKASVSVNQNLLK